MSKSPAFQFYPKDFLVGVMGMPDEQVGIYIRMLAVQWERGGLPSDPKAIKNLVGSRKPPSQELLEKFPVNENGLRQNPRMEKERQKQEDFAKSRKEAADRRWEKERLQREEEELRNARALHNENINDALHSSSSSSENNTPLPPEGELFSGEEEGATNKEQAYPAIVEALWKATTPVSRVRSAKAKVLKSWRRTRNKPSEEQVLASLLQWASSRKWTSDNGQYGTGLHTWITNRGWESAPEEQTTNAGQSFKSAASLNI
jgi:uncharacterized protein YdaU (DUF1376 family)